MIQVIKAIDLRKHMNYLWQRQPPMAQAFAKVSNNSALQAKVFGMLSS